MKRRSSSGAPVVWRGGVHIVGTQVWCDALRMREACFVSSALVPEARRHRQIIATALTLELLPGAGALAGKRAPRALAVPYGRPFSLGDVRLELYPSGAMAGAASLLVETSGVRVAYGGTIDPRGRSAGAAEVRPSDVLVVDATFADPIFDFPPAAQVLADVAAWTGEVVAAGDTPVILTSLLALGPDLLGALIPPHTVRAPRALVEVARKLGAPLPQRLGTTVAPGEVVLFPASRRDAAAVASLPRTRFALASGWALDPDTVARLRVERAFPLAEQAGHRDLVEYARASGATSVYLLGTRGREGELARALSSRSLRVQRLGPHEQLRLF